MKVAIRKILFPTDFSESANQAQKYAYTLALPFQAELHALHVVHDPFPMPSAVGLPVAPPADLLSTIVRQSETELAKQMAEDMKSYAHIVCAVRVGDPVREIKQYADTHGIDLIVMGTHGLTGVAHFLIGSVTEKLVRLAQCPVLTVHPNGHQFIM